MSCSVGSSTVFAWCQDLATISKLSFEVSVCVAYVRFHAAVKAQRVDGNTLQSEFPFQPYLAYVVVCFFSIVIAVSVFVAFALKVDYQVKVTEYIGIPVYFGLRLLWRLFKRTHFISVADADIYAGKAALNALVWPEQIPKDFP